MDPSKVDEVKKYEMFINLEVFQYEGIDSVLNKIQELGIGEISISPEYFEETGDNQDLRLPPLDLDGGSRNLDRSLWGGSNVVYGKKQVMFKPEDKHYGVSTYRPKYGCYAFDLCQQVVLAAKARNIQINIMAPWNPQIAVLEEDCHRDVFGRIRPLQISERGCINSDNISNYYIGMVKDLSHTYHPNGIQLDWIEFTNYAFADNMVCLCPNCKKKAKEWDYDFQSMKHSVEEVFSWIRACKEIPTGNNLDWNGIWKTMSPGIFTFFQFKTKSCLELISKLRGALDDDGFEHILLIFPGFAYPMNTATGFDFDSLSRAIHTVRIETKAYRFHWGMMVKWYAAELACIHGNSNAVEWIPFAKNMLEVPDDSVDPSYYTMPSPSDLGPVSLESEFSRLDHAIATVKNPQFFSFRLHTYGPLAQFEKRLHYAENSAYQHISIQRYGYLGDEKMQLFADVRKPID